ncbi:hypothetical protein E4U30_001534 [Claviceps sp. LM220 group G6]|nr:hypothetical protein E4U15_002100 [Claviceps sp. LM218 group G6]KAG6101641.1 hypothetical protein E4U30_001534 [Claviceps sp. LM220 group G6]KAG6106517.1 hypothetical protein E4U31_000787 [Claviceps sp. LM219 group G6]
MKHILSALALAGAVMGDAGAFERCGGHGWTGSTTCIAGFTCTVSNDWYSQCLPVPIQNGGQAGPYEQCGGRGWNGTTVCTDGYRCKFINGWYSQCVLASGSLTNSTDSSTTLMTVTVSSTSLSSEPLTTQTPWTTTEAWTTTSAAPSSTSAPSSTAPLSTAPASTEPASAPGKLKWFGVSESAAEFAPDKIPGVPGQDYSFPDIQSINGLIKEGYNIFRIPFLLERMASPSLSSPLQTDYLNSITEIINAITKQGKHAILDAHNYGRYNGNIITDTKAFQTFWTNLAGKFADNDNVIFDLNNEYHDLEQTLVLQLNQAGIDGVRASGAKTQYIFAEGNSYSGAWTWTKVNDNLKALVDPENKLIYEMHQYLDADGSGSGTDCVSSTIGKERLADATKWLRDNKKVGVIGEYAGGANDQCKAAVSGMLDHMQENSDVWNGALWWGAGPWWHEYRYSFEAPSGVGYQSYNNVLKKYTA